jgi:hypothetical protein
MDGRVVNRGITLKKKQWAKKKLKGIISIIPQSDPTPIIAILISVINLSKGFLEFCSWGK